MTSKKKKDETQKICYTVSGKPMTERVMMECLQRESWFGETGTDRNHEMHSGGSV